MRKIKRGMLLIFLPLCISLFASVPLQAASKDDITIPEEGSYVIGPSEKAGTSKEDPNHANAKTNFYLYIENVKNQEDSDKLQPVIKKGSSIPKTGDTGINTIFLMYLLLFLGSGYLISRYYAEKSKVHNHSQH